MGGPSRSIGQGFAQAIGKLLLAVHVIGSLLVGQREYVLGNGLIVIGKIARDINSVGTRHAIIASGTGNNGETSHHVGNFLKHLVFGLGTQFKGGEGANVFLQMVHLVHTAQRGEDIGVRANPSEGPSRRAVIRTQSGELLAEVIAHARQRTATQGLHHNGLHTGLLHLIIEILGIGIVPPTRFFERRMPPIKIIHLNLSKIPMVLILMIKQEIKHADIAMIGESQVANAASFTFPHQEIEQTVVEETGLEILNATASDAVEQIVIDVIDSQLTK